MSLVSRSLRFCVLLCGFAGASPTFADFNFEVYDGDFNQLPNFASLSPIANGNSEFIGVDVTNQVDTFALVFRNTLQVSVEARYEFETTSDDGSRLYINNNLVVDNDGLHAPVTETGSIFLPAGSHQLRVEFFEKTGGEVLNVRYRIEGGIYAAIPANGQLNAEVPNRADVGEWGSVIDWPHIAISAANLPDGRVLTWSSTETNAFPSNREFTHAAVFDPTNNTFVTTDSNFHDMFCAGIAMLEDGRIVASGGNPNDNRTSMFDPVTLTWAPLADMFDRRWYATSVMLPSNEIFASFGRASADRTEKYQADLDQWLRTTNTNVQTLLQEHNAHNNSGGDSQWWPQLTVQPDGTIFHGGPTQTFHVFDPVHDTEEQSLGRLAGDRFRMWGNSIAYDVGKVLLVGGADRSANPVTVSNNVRRVDLNGPTPVISNGAPMNFARALSNSLTLPNGEILVVGGNRDGAIFNDDTAVMPAELYDPVSDSWQVMDSIDVPRTYHSTATLLKDGRVLAAGGGGCGGCSANHLDGQIFSPPYLFDADGQPAARPSLSNLPTQADPGRRFTVNASASTQRFTMIRLAGHTHHINTDHRFLPVDATSLGGGQFELTLNANPNVLLPGYYWVFAIDAKGTPSIGATLQILRPGFLSQPNPEPEPQPDPGNGGGPVLNLSAQSAQLNGAFNRPAGSNSIEVPESVGDEYGFRSDLSYADFAFVVETAGVYQIEAEVLAPDGRSDSFWVQVNGSPSPAYLWDTGLSSTFRPVRVSDRSAGVLSFTLQPGNNLVRFYHREDGTRLRNVRLVLIGASGADSDGDGVADDADAFPNNPNETSDSDGDGVGDNADAFPNDASETRDSDGDGFGDNADSTPSSGSNIVALPARPRNSTTLVVERRGSVDRIWNVNPDNNSVSVSSESGNLIAEIAVGQEPWSIALSPQQDQVLVTNKADATVSVINAASLAIVNNIALPFASQPHGIVVNSSGTDYFVALEASAQVIRKSTNSHQTLSSRTLSGSPRHLALTFDNSRLLVSNFITPPLPGEDTATVNLQSGGGQVFVLNPGNLALQNQVRISHDNRQLSESRGPGLPNYLNAPVVAFDDAFAYVPSKKDNIGAGALRGNPGMSFDHTVRANTALIDLASAQEVAPGIDFDNSSLATGAALTGDNRYLLVALETSRELAVYDTQGGFQLMRLTTGLAPQGVALSSDSRVAYVHNFMGRSISRFDLTEMIETALPASNPLPEIDVVGNEALSNVVLLGKQLFYDARDDRLARDNYMSCASCHNEGGQDGRTWDFTQFGEGLRNTIALNGRSATGHGFLHWSANFDEIQDFEGQIRAFAGGTGLMSDAAFNSGTRNQPLGDPKAGVSTALDALAAYVGSLDRFAASPDRTQSGALTASAEAGRTVFAAENCSICHAGTAFSNSTNATTLADVGTISPSSGNRLGSTLNRIDIPTLRDVWQTAPYLHDGSAATLAEAITAHQGISVAGTDLNNLVDYVRQIGGQETNGGGGSPGGGGNQQLTAFANQATLTGDFVLSSDSQFIEVPEDRGDRYAFNEGQSRAEFSFVVTIPGNYEIEATVQAPDGRSDSFYVRVNDAPTTPYLWDTTRSGGFSSRRIQNRGANAPVRVQLAAGNQQVTIYHREDGTRLSQLRLVLIN